MKYFKLLLTILIISFNVNAQTKITAPLVRNNPNDLTYGSHFDSLGYAGLVVFSTIGNRNAHPTALRKRGMVAVIRDSIGIIWQLQGGITNSNWYRFSLADGGVGGPSTDAYNNIDSAVDNSYVVFITPEGQRDTLAIRYVNGGNGSSGSQTLNQTLRLGNRSDTGINLIYTDGQPFNRGILLKDSVRSNSIQLSATISSGQTYPWISMSSGPFGIYNSSWILENTGVGYLGVGGGSGLDNRSNTLTIPRSVGAALNANSILPDSGIGGTLIKRIVVNGNSLIGSTGGTIDLGTIGGSNADSFIFSTNYRRDTAISNIRDALASKWSKLGDAGTLSSTNFIGTIDDVPLRFRINNIVSGDLSRSTFNTGFGYSTNTGGSNNALYGYSVIPLATNPIQNALLGRGIGNLSTSMNTTSALGYAILNQAQGSYSNTVMGWGSFARANNAHSNVGVGISISNFNASSSADTLIGNTWLGTFAAERQFGGRFNLFAGYGAGRYSTTGSRNVLLGSFAGENENGNDKLYIDNTGTATPLIGGDFALDRVDINGTLKITGGTPGINKVFTDIDGTGLGAWVTSTGTVTNVTATAPMSITGISTIAPNVIADTSKSQGKLATFNDVSLKWGINGNAGTNPAVHYVGSTDTAIRVGGFGGSTFDLRLDKWKYTNTADTAIYITKLVSSSTRLTIYESNGTTVSAGGTESYLVQHGPYSNFLDAFDITAANAGAGSIVIPTWWGGTGTRSNGIGIERKRYLNQRDTTLFIIGTGVSQAAHVIHIINTSADKFPAIMYVHDTYLGTTTRYEPKKIDTVRINFTIDANAGSRGLRFRLYYEPRTTRVGINTLNPDSTFHLVGGLKLDLGTQGADKVLTSDATGGASWRTPSVGGTTETASNGLTKTVNDIKLGGSLTAATTITNGVNTLNITGTGNSTIFEKVLNVTYTGSESLGSAIYGTTTNGYGVQGFSTNSSGIKGIGAVGVEATGTAFGLTASDGSTAASTAINVSKGNVGSGSGVNIVYIGGGTTNTVGNPIKITQSSNTGASDYMKILTGTSADLGTYNLRIRSPYTSGGGINEVDAFVIATTKTNVTERLDADVQFKLGYNGLQDILKLSGSGQIRFNKYGINTFTGTATYALGVDASGNIVETPAVKYKVYTAILNQTGTNAPTAIVLDNTLGATISYTRNAAGWYTVTCSSPLFITNKLVVFLSRTAVSPPIDQSFTTNTTSDFYLFTNTSADVGQDSSMGSGLPIEIRVYN